jgi:hypothetical protein
MLRAMMIAMACAAISSAVPDLSGAHALVKSAIAAVGIRHDLHALRSMQATTRSVSMRLFDGDHSDAPYYAEFGNATVTDDFMGGRTMSETTMPASSAGPGWTMRSVLTHDVGQTQITYAGTARPPASAAAPPSWETRNPIRALLLADRAQDLTREEDTVSHGAPVHVVVFHNGGYRVRLLIDAATGLPNAVEALVAFPGDVGWDAWGDVCERTDYMNWNLVDGVRYPYQWDISQNGLPSRILSIIDAHADVPIDPAQFTVLPAAARVTNADEFPLGRAIPNSPNPNKPIAEIAPGVVQIPGSWYTTIVRQSDGVVVIDAPISAGYSSQVITEAGRRFPGVPVKALIMSTSFWWHIAGVREYAARGIPIYLLDRNEALIRAILASPHTIVPDDLARTPREPIIRAVSGRTTIGSGPNTLVLFPIRRATGNMMMTYVSDAHLLDTAEMVQPLGPNGSLLFPESLLELKEAIRDAGIRADSMIGTHMSPTPLSALDEALRAAGVDPKI